MTVEMNNMWDITSIIYESWKTQEIVYEMFPGHFYCAVNKTPEKY